MKRLIGSCCCCEKKNGGVDVVVKRLRGRWFRWKVVRLVSNSKAELDGD